MLEGSTGWSTAGPRFGRPPALEAWVVALELVGEAVADEALGAAADLLDLGGGGPPG